MTMASDFQGQFTAAASLNFQQRVAAALRAAAIQVYGENAATPGHAARAAYALKVVQNAPVSMVRTNRFSGADPDLLVYAWASLLAAQGFDSSSSDAAIEAQIVEDWNAMAGVS
jgi:hypothetical protein